MALAATEVDAERSDLLEMLGKQRNFLRYTTQGLTDEQARARARDGQRADPWRPHQARRGRRTELGHLYRRGAPALGNASDNDRGGLGTAAG